MTPAVGRDGRVARSVRMRVGAVAVVFAVNGALYGSLAPRLPDVADRLGIGPGGLGLLLLTFSIGGVAGSVAAGPLLHRRPVPGLLRVSVTAGAVALTAVVAAERVGVAAVSFLVAGMADGLMDVTVNGAGVAVQRQAGRSVMQRLHAAWSMGFLTAAGVASAAAGVGVGAGVQVPLALGAATVLAWSAAGRLDVDAAPAPAAPPASIAPGQARRWPSAASGPDGLATPAVAPVRASSRRSRRVRWRHVTGSVVLLGAMAALGAIAEGTSADWSALYLSDELGAGPGVAGLGVVAAMVGMVLARLAGDRIVDRLGPARALQGAAAVAATGSVLGWSVGGVAGAVAGFACLGAGSSLVYPVLFTAAGDSSGLRPATAMSMVSTIGRAGFLTGPVAIGLLADATSLRLAIHIGPFAAVLVAVASLAMPAPPRGVRPVDRSSPGGPSRSSSPSRPAPPASSAST